MLAALATPLLLALVAAETPSDVVATVNGEPITRGELVNELIVRHGKAVLEDLIRQRAVEQEVVRAGITVTDEEVANEIERERAELAAAEARRRAADPSSGEAATLEQMVERRYQMSLEGYRSIVRRWLQIRKLILRKENPTEDEVMLWFYQNRERYDVPAQIAVRHIFIARKDPATGRERTDAELQERASKVREGLVRGTDFAQLARRYSDDSATRASGGELGVVNERAAREHLEPAFVEAMLALKPGQSGGPVATPKGLHYLQVTARQEGRKVEYDSVRTRVRLDYLEERALLLREPFLRELMERARITREFTLPAGSSALGAAGAR